MISGNRIAAARCTLPITQRKNIPANYGMRHKAAIGITEETDADAIVVSVISYLFVVAWKPSVLLRPFVRADEVVQNVFQTLLLHFFVLLATLSLFTTVQISSLSVIVAYLAFFVLLCAEKLALLQIIKNR